MGGFNKNIFIWIALALGVLALFNIFQGQGLLGTNDKNVAYSEFLKSVEGGQVSEVTIQGKNIQFREKGSATPQTTYAPSDPSLIPELKKKDVTVNAKAPDDGGGFMSYVVYWLPFIIMIGIWVFFMRQMQGGGKGGALGFGKSKAKMLTEGQTKITFENVAGVEEAKQELQEVVDFLKSPQKFQRLGGQIPKGVLLLGPPGTGKTLLARAVAGEADVPFFSISGSDFVEMFVGVGASRVRDMFEQGKKNAPCIIFIDEIDAVGRHRGAGLGGGNDEREQTLNQLLVEMDGFESNEGVILIAATNRPDVLDPALLRPGRFDRQIVVPNPDILGRDAILRVHMRKVPLAPDVNSMVLARGTPGFSGAELANLVNEAALLAARRNRRMVSMKEFEDAKDKVMMGAERRSMVMTEDEKKLTAYHEAGHAVVMLHAEGHAPLHKVTIIPRGRALGVTFALPERDQLSISEKELKAQLASMFGGRVAEEIIFGKENITTGASNDIQQATRIARAMVTEYGFSSKLGPLRYSNNEEEIFLGHSVTQQKNVSDSTSKIIDEEVKALVEGGETKAREIIGAHRNELELIAQGLLEYETLSRKEIDTLLSGGQINRDDTPTNPSASTGVPQMNEDTPKDAEKEGQGEVKNSPWVPKS